MKTSLLALSLVGLMLAPLAAPAQTTRFAVVDLRKCFDGYWKTKRADGDLKEEANGLDKERKTMVEQFQKAQDGYKTLLDNANDQAVSSEERDKRKKAAEAELLRLKELQTNIEQFDRQARATLGEKQRRMRENIVGEIKDVVKTKAKAGNYALVLDLASESANNTPVLLYSSGENDLTDSVLAQLNANAPASLKTEGSGSGGTTKP